MISSQDDYSVILRSIFSRLRRKMRTFLIAILYINLLSIILNISIYLHYDISKLLFNVVAGQIHLQRTKATCNLNCEVIFPRY